MDDKLVYKQISILDEEDLVLGNTSVEDLERMREDFVDQVFRVMQSISFINPQRRNWHLLRIGGPVINLGTIFP